MNLDSFLQRAQRIMGSVTRGLRTDSSEENLNASLARLHSLARNVSRMSTRFTACEQLLPEIQEAIDIAEGMKRSRSGVSARPPSHRGSRGRPQFIIHPEQLELLLELQFTNKDIAVMLHVSESVVKRRLREFGLNRRHRYSSMSNDELDRHVQRITDGNLSLGQRNVLGQLRAEGHIVQRERVADSLNRVDAAAVAMRWSRTIHRRAYQVPGPNALWHIDGNHKLIRWGIVIHGGMDGHSRLIVFLRTSANNRPATVMDSFLQATHAYGVPSRVRCDHGVENLDVAAFMNAYRGHNRGSCLTGRSVHNQRIERFWRDLYMGCTNVHKQLFEHLEEEGILHLDNTVELWCLQYVYLSRLNRDLKRFADGWNHHRLSTCRGKTPLQLYVQGILELRGQGQTGVDELFFEPSTNTDQVHDDFGIDYHDTVPQEDEDIDWPSVDCPLSEENMEQLKQQIDPLSLSVDGFGIDIYLGTIDFCIAHQQ